MIELEGLEFRSALIPISTCPRVAAQDHLSLSLQTQPDFWLTRMSKVRSHFKVRSTRLMDMRRKTGHPKSSHSHQIQPSLQPLLILGHQTLIVVQGRHIYSILPTLIQPHLNLPSRLTKEKGKTATALGTIREHSELM
jgi:hypothetical protein